MSFINIDIYCYLHLFHVIKKSFAFIYKSIQKRSLQNGLPNQNSSRINRDFYPEVIGRISDFKKY